MKRETRSSLPLAILWVAILLTTVYFIVEGLKVAAEPTSKIIAAVLTGLFALIGGYITHLLATERERGAEQLRRKQERYAKILDGLIPYIRDPDAKAVKFANPVLHAYVASDKRVASAIHSFLNARTSANLDAIINSMRKDLRMEALESSTSTEGLVPAKEPKVKGSI